MAKRVYARRPHGYGDKQLDRGQVIELQNLRNDEKLQRLGFLMELPKNTSLRECNRCGAKFIDEGLRNAHYEKLHELGELLTPEDEDYLEESEEKELNEVAPLFLDKTKASLGLV